MSCQNAADLAAAVAAWIEALIQVWLLVDFDSTLESAVVVIAVEVVDVLAVDFDWKPATVDSEDYEQSLLADWV